MARPRVTESDAVVDAAVAQLTSHGIAATTVDDVARRAGVSRATVYRYVGGKHDLVQAVIARELTDVLDRAASAITQAPTVTEAIADAVSAALTTVEANPLLARLTSTDLVDSLPHATIDSAPLVAAAVARLRAAWRAAPHDVDEGALDDAIEEAARFCLAHIAVPRRDGTRYSPDVAGQRAAALIAPLLNPDHRS